MIEINEYTLEDTVDEDFCKEAEQRSTFNKITIGNGTNKARTDEISMDHLNEYIGGRKYQFINSLFYHFDISKIESVDRISVILKVLNRYRFIVAEIMGKDISTINTAVVLPDINHLKEVYMHYDNTPNTIVISDYNYPDMYICEPDIHHSYFNLGTFDNCQIKFSELGKFIDFWTDRYGNPQIVIEGDSHKMKSTGCKCTSTEDTTNHKIVITDLSPSERDKLIPFELVYTIENLAEFKGEIEYGVNVRDY